MIILTAAAGRVVSMRRYQLADEYRITVSLARLGQNSLNAGHLGGR